MPRTVISRPPSEQLQTWQREFGWDVIRGDGRLERTCSHGIGHTVGHVRGYQLMYDGVHGCDGCLNTFQENHHDES